MGWWVKGTTGDWASKKLVCKCCVAAEIGRAATTELGLNIFGDKTCCCWALPEALRFPTYQMNAEHYCRILVKLMECFLNGFILMGSFHGRDDTFFVKYFRECG